LGSGRASPKNGGDWEFGKGIWEQGLAGSWSTLQGLASSVLGNVVGENGIEGERGVGSDVGKNRARGNSAGKKPAATWGPSGLPRRRDDGIGAGSFVERDLAVRAMKTASVLESHGGANGGLDVNGNFKRRSSRDIPNSLGQDDDALVYVHHVQPHDTQAGVVLRYNCQPTVFRTANRLWQNDSIQSRKIVLIPVDACVIKGRPCNPPTDNQPIDLLAPTPETEESPSSPRAYQNGGWSHNLQNGGSSSNDVPCTDDKKAEDDRQPWVHVRWVLLDSSPSSKPVEIARLPRKTLGYFPPRRRKSQTAFSSLSTPRISSDLRFSEEISRTKTGTSAHRGSSPGARPGSGSYFPSPTSNPRSRSESMNESTAPPSWMRGSGGVGTLSKDVRSPGPAGDRLNTWAAKHVPFLGIGNLPSSSAAASDTVSFGFSDELASIAEGHHSFPTAAGSGTATPSGHGAGLGLEQAAAAIESWVRKLAVKATAPGTPRLSMGMGSKGTPELGEGDLIELLDGTGSDDGRGFEVLSQTSSRTIAGSSGRAEPSAGVRGRTTGKGKSD
jgi:hypothetical protein